MEFITGTSEAHALTATPGRAVGSHPVASTGAGITPDRAHVWLSRASVSRALPYLILAAAVVLCALLLYPPLSAVPFHVFKNYNEGWNAYQATFALSGDKLYRPLNDLVSNNYPPLSFYIIGFLSYVFGDPLIVGRVVSVLGLLVVSLNIALIIRSQNRRWLTPVFFAITFLALCASLFTTYVGMNDPSWLAHAVMTSGFALFLYNRTSRRAVALAAALMVLAGLIKHNLLPLPLAVTIWLAFNDRARFRVWMASAVTCSATALLAMFVAYGSNLFAEILVSPRVYSIDKLFRFFGRVSSYGLITPGLIFLILAARIVVPTLRDASMWLFVLYFLLSGLMTVAVLPAAGIGQSALFDLMISALCLLGTGLQRIESSAEPGHANAILCTTMLTILLPALVMLPQKMHGADRLHDLRQRQAETASDIDFIRRHPGPALCEDLSLCFWSAKPFLLDFFSGGQKMRAGVVDLDAFVARVNNEEFALIQYMHNGQNGRHRLPEQAEEAIAKHYRIVRVSTNGVFLAPARGRPNEPAANTTGAPTIRNPLPETAPLPC